MNHSVAKYALEALIAGALFSVIWIAFNIIAKPDDRIGGYRQLVEQHATAEARATATHCDDHGRVNYSFEAQGKTFVGETYWLAQPCDSIRPGIIFPVNYAPSDPALNTTMEPEKAYSFHLSQLFFNVLWVAGIVFLLVGWRFRKKA